MNFWTQLWTRLKHVPVGLWAALGVAVTVLGMYLRGRRLEAALAQEQLKSAAAHAASLSAKSEGKATVHLENAAAHEAKAEKLQQDVVRVQSMGKTEQKQLAALPPSAVEAEYLKLAQRKKAGET